MKKLTFAELLQKAKDKEREVRQNDTAGPDPTIILLSLVSEGIPHIIQRLEELEEGITLTADIYKRIGERQDELFKLLEELVSEE